ncbi:MAG: TIGR02186 family protein [Proteobacteria bacterium]|nr:TIGR02186 family protein [Pseudomonadota bacterium]
MGRSRPARGGGPGPLAAALALVLAAAPARAEPLVADLSRHLVEITAGFVGADVLLYGAIEGDGDVVVVLRGPKTVEVVRQKVRLGGIWVNGPSVRFREVPAFYLVASSRPAAELKLDPLVTGQYEIGLESLKIEAAGERDPRRIAEFRAALVRLKQENGLYSSDWGRVGFLGTRLFSTHILFPANVPTGSYTVSVFLVRNGEIVGAQTTPLVVSKAGVGAEVYDFAHDLPALYGIIAVLVALAAGWLANAAFRKV